MRTFPQCVSLRVPQASSLMLKWELESLSYFMCIEEFAPSEPQGLALPGAIAEPPASLSFVSVNCYLRLPTQFRIPSLLCFLSTGNSCRPLASSPRL